MKKIFIMMAAMIFMAASCEKETLIEKRYDAPKKTTTSAVVQLGEGWQGFSTNIEMQSMDAADFFGQYPEIEIAKTIDGRVYWNVNGTVINTIGDINCIDGYLLHLTAPCEIEMEGVYTSQTMPQTLPVGWSMWGCPFVYPTYPNTAYPMPQPAAQTDIIKHVPTGLVFWENYNINKIGQIAPYNAYMVHIDDGQGWTHKQIEEFNGFGRLVEVETKDGICIIQTQPSYYSNEGVLCDEENAVMCIMPDGEVIWM